MWPEEGVFFTAPVNKDTVAVRLDFIREQVKNLQMAGDSDLLSAKLRDPFVFNGMVRMLQTSVEAMIDLAYHLCAKLYAKAPENAAHAFEILREGGAISGEFLLVATEMVRFRNRVVHGYLNKNPEAVRRMLQEHLGDFAVWERLVSDILRGQESATT